MAKLRHVSLHTADPEKTAEFYKRVFDMVEVGRTDSKFAEGIFLSDGTINLSVVRFKPKRRQTGATASVRLSVCITLIFG
jgi:catechol 2,3-dioxygenase-like lactoylglutathione lyase family enzyme